MQKYYRNVYDFIERFSEDDFLEPEELEEFRYGDDDLYFLDLHDRIGFSPREAGYSLNAMITSIEKAGDKYKVTVSGSKDKDGEKYEIEWLVKKGTLLEVNCYEQGVACFCPPSDIPIVIKIVEVDEKQLQVIPWGIDAFYADKDKARSFNTTFDEELVNQQLEKLREEAKVLADAIKAIREGKEVEGEKGYYVNVFANQTLEIEKISDDIEELDAPIQKRKSEKVEFEKEMREKWGERWWKEE